MTKKIMQSPRSPADDNQPVDEPNIVGSGLGAPPVSHGKMINPVLPDDEETTQNAVEQGVEDAEDDSAAEADQTKSRDEV
jgi:hypothetical protein